jgi:hypothetical protein
MSGGSFDYLYLKVKDMAEEIGVVKSKEEIEFSKLLEEIVPLLYSIEWAYSGDTKLEDFKKEWRKFKGEKLK